MNKFSVDQLEVIRDLAGCYWDNHCNTYGGLSQSSLEKIREEYIEDITKGLTDPEYW